MSTNETRDWEISFSGCGLLAFYHAGVGQCVQERAPHMLKKISAYYGASAGAITAVMAACKLDAKKGFTFLKTVHEASRHWALGRFGVFHPHFDLQRRLKEFLNDTLPRNAHRMCRGKVHISLTVLPEMRNWLVTDFNTRAELINALLASSYIPVWGGLTAPRFRGKMCIDGGLTDNLPVTSNPHLITVTPFSGEADICPNDSSSIHQTFICGIHAQVCWSNIRKSVGAILPMKWEEVETLYHQGYQDTLHFLEREGLVSPGVMDVPQSPVSERAVLEDSTSDYYSMGHSRQSSTLPGLEEMIDEDSESEEELKEEEESLRKNLTVAVLTYLNSQQLMESVSLPWQRIKEALQASKKEQLILLRRLWHAIRVVRQQMEKSLTSLSDDKESLNCKNLFLKALNPPVP